MNENMAKRGLGDNARWGTILALGMLVLIWRIIIPTNVEITTATVVLTAGLDLALTAAVVFLARKELKEVFARKFALKDVLKTIAFFAVSYIVMMVFGVLLLVLTADGVTLGGFMANAQDPAWLESIMANAPVPPSEWVAEQYAAVFPLGVVISMVICAPVWEEIAFRMAGRNLLKNPVLYVAASSCLFAFIHTVNFSIAENSTFLVFGAIYAVGYLILKDVRILMITHCVNNIIAVSGLLLA
ncbi:MAG: CPBP family intramembrane metalloprotease [Clostridiales bacterium]|nr:CPBP family intramembrane metalloprotease [Clostridiales bacterium]